MNLLHGMAKELREFLAPPSRSTYSGPLQVQNLTRGTKLALRLEAAHSGPSRRKGLLGRKSLEPGEGLWIAPCESVHTFFMKFPIDLVYLDRNHQVKKVRSDVGAWRLSGCLSARSVLELPAGTIQETRTETGRRAGDRLRGSRAEITNAAACDQQRETTRQRRSAAEKSLSGHGA